MGIPFAAIRTLLRGQIPLRRTFWFFGVAVPLIFSFIFISSQTTISSIVGKSSNAVLYFDYFLMGVYVIFGIFIVVAIWRSSNKYQGAKRWSRLAKLSGIIIVLWFVANLGLYIFVKTFIPPAFEAKIDYIPEKFKLPTTAAEPDSIYLNSFKLNFPFYKEDIRKAYPFFLEHRFRNISIFLDNHKGIILFDEIPDSLPGPRQSITSKIWEWLLNMDYYGSYIKTLRQIHYSRLADYSWWNLRYNLRLATNLILKAIAIPAYDELKVYDVITPYLSGYLTTGYRKHETSLISFYYNLGGKTFNLSAFTGDKEVINKIMSILSTIQPVGDIEKGYSDMEAQYNQKDKTRYPKELLLLSLISLKGLTLANLKELRQLEEEIPDNKYAIDEINREINSLSQPHK